MGKYGEVLTDTTTFTLTQQIFDNPIETSLEQLKNLEATIQYLIFYEKIWILKPTVFGANINVKIPQLANTLIEEEIIKEYLPNFYSNTENFFKNQYEDLKILIAPNTIENFCKPHKYAHSELGDYERYYQFSSHMGAQDLAHKVGVSDYSLIPPVANLIRTRIYLQAVQEMKEDTDRIITYSPHFMRTSLVEALYDDIRKNNLQTLFDHVLKELESKERAERDYYHRIYGTKFELDLPILTSIVLSKCETKYDIVDTILDIRKGNDAQRIRRFFNKIHIAIENDDIDSLKKYNIKLRNYLEDFQTTSSTTAILNCIPRLSPNLLRSVAETTGGLLTFAATANPGSVPSIVGGISEGVKEVFKYFSRRDTTFLVNLKHSTNNIKCSREDFSRVFGSKLK